MEKLDPKLEKLLQVIRTDNIITPQEVEQLLEGLVDIIETFLEKSETLNREVEGKIKRGLQQMAEQHNKVFVEMEEGKAVTQENASEIVNQMVEKANKRIDKLIAEVKALMPKDGEPGKDADVNEVIEAVLQKIKLPEYKELQPDTGEEIVAKINEMEGEENKIDASRIKNLPKAKAQMSGMVGVKNVTSTTFTVTDTANFNKDISIPIQPTAPSNPHEGMLWIDNS